MTDVMPEIQRSIVLKFLKSKLGDNIVISSNYLQDFSKSLTLFMFYLTTISQEITGFKRKTITVDDVKKAVQEIGFEDYLSQLDDIVISDSIKPRSSKLKKKASERLNDPVELLIDDLKDIGVDYMGEDNLDPAENIEDLEVLSDFEEPEAGEIPLELEKNTDDNEV
jgi:histone H3/H4